MLIDLSGSLDSNPASAAVAQKYKRECDHRLIVSDVVSAVTDKTAEDLLNDENAQRQLKMDGGINSVTIVCTKTDNLTVDEIAGSCLDSEEHIEKLMEERMKIEAAIERVRAHLSSLDVHQRPTFKEVQLEETDVPADQDIIHSAQLSQKRRLSAENHEARKILQIPILAEKSTETEPLISQDRIKSVDDIIAAIKKLKMNWSFCKRGIMISELLSSRRV